MYWLMVVALAFAAGYLVIIGFESNSAEMVASGITCSVIDLLVLFVGGKK